MTKIPTKLKLLIYKTAIRPALLYGLSQDLWLMRCACCNAAWISV